MKRTVRAPRRRALRASAIASRSSLTPERTAESGTNRAPAGRRAGGPASSCPVPGRPQRISEGSGPPAVDEPAQQPALADQVRLADELVERPGPHPLGQRGVAGSAAGAELVVRLVEQSAPSILAASDGSRTVPFARSSQIIPPRFQRFAPLVRHLWYVEPGAKSTNVTSRCGSRDDPLMHWKSSIKEESMRLASGMMAVGLGSRRSSARRLPITPSPAQARQARRAALGAVGRPGRARLRRGRTTGSSPARSRTCTSCSPASIPSGRSSSST